jgi:hypothetical protein
MESYLKQDKENRRHKSSTAPKYQDNASNTFHDIHHDIFHGDLHDVRHMVSSVMTEMASPINEAPVSAVASVVGMVGA